MMQTALKLLLLLTFAGHAALWYCDKIITCLPGGRFSFKQLQDNRLLAATMGDTPPAQPMRSIMLGIFAMTAMLPGYLALSDWMRQFSETYAVLMAAGSILFFLPGTAHHVFCGAVEWAYLRMGKTAEARKQILTFFRQTSATMYACYLGLLLFSVSFFLAVVSGATSLPRWACLCNTLPVVLLLAPFRIVGVGNAAGTIVFLGLFLLL